MIDVSKFCEHNCLIDGALEGTLESHINVLIFPRLQNIRFTISSNLGSISLFKLG